MKKWGKSLSGLLLLILCLILSACGQVSAQNPQATGISTPRSNTKKNTICLGVSAGDIDLSGLTTEQALEKLEKEAPRLLSMAQISITGCGKTFVLDGKVLRPSLCLQQTVQEAYDVGRIGGYFARQKQKQQASRQGIQVGIPMTIQPDKVQLEKRIQEILKQMNVPAKNAKLLHFNPDAPKGKRLSLEKEISGRRVDESLLRQALKQRIQEVDFAPIILHIQPVAPTVKQNQLTPLDESVIRFTTQLLPNADRNVNIDLCSARLTHLLVLPGQNVSINQRTGPRTERKGYRLASTIIGGRSEDSTGGGVCQVAGTLYNAVLLADLQVVKRYNHSLISNYLPPALDATLVYGSKDFVFRNNRTSAIYLVRKLDIKKRTLTFEIYGAKRTDGLVVSMQSQVIENIPQPQGYRVMVDKKQPKGFVEVYIKARAGVKAQAYKIYRDGKGNIVKKLLVSQDEYPPTTLTYRVGPDTLVGKQ